MDELAIEKVYEELQGIRRELIALRGQVQSLAARLGDKAETRPSYRLAVVLEPDEGGGYVVTSTVLPELVTEGDDREEALRNAKEAAEDLLEVMLEDRDELPADLQGYRPGDPLEIVGAMPEGQ